MEKEEEKEIFKQWEELEKISDEYYVYSQRLIKNSDFKYLGRKILNSPDARYFIYLLQSLIHDDRQLIKEFFHELLDHALLGNPTSILSARPVIKMIENDWLKDRLYTAIKEMLFEIDTKEPHESFWAYRRAYELLDYIGFREEIINLLENCKIHNDPDVIELYDDYYTLYT
ncbi:hypothetical protein [Emticicia fluvialis]|uniref:hypothetical protein n=1 Tax=Emticicia fluvialis TaxID=2974474 RepID=UPI002166A428|nr:hypothetical protein [Emticicia fluvialis]